MMPKQVPGRRQQPIEERPGVVDMQEGLVRPCSHHGRPRSHPIGPPKILPKLCTNQRNANMAHVLKMVAPLLTPCQALGTGTERRPIQRTFHEIQSQ